MYTEDSGKGGLYPEEVAAFIDRINKLYRTYFPPESLLKIHNDTIEGIKQMGEKSHTAISAKDGSDAKKQTSDGIVFLSDWR